MTGWFRPAALSLGLAVFAGALLLDNWAPARAAWYVAGWLVVTVAIFFGEYRRQKV
ncbi:hypothetical protein [Nocardia sp. NPDC005978]|uniref:hypothetical protein n=1 Tax=unclassified Nocardia TaxID=2637762 RepID=UPI0033BC1451